MDTTRTFNLSALATVFVSAASLWAAPLPPVNDEGNLSTQDGAAALVIYNRNYTGPCFADYVPSAAEVKAPFVVRVARNEYEPMQVGLYVPSSASELKDVKLKVRCDIPSTIGHLYYQPKEDLDWIGNLDKERGKPWEGKRWALPSVIIPENHISTIKPGRSGAFWLTFHTIEMMAPGDYQGQMEILAEGQLQRSIPFTIKVYSFALPRPAIPFGLYFYPYRLDPQFQSRALQKLYLADLAAHGMNTMFVTVDYRVLSQPDYDETSSTPHQEAWYSTSSRRYCDNYLMPDDYQREGEYNVIKMIDAQVTMGREAGLIQNDTFVIAQPSDHTIENKAVMAAALDRLSVEKGWPDFVLYMRDEPGPDAFAKVIDHVSQWKRLGMKTTCAMSLLAAFAVGHVHDVWIVHANYITPQMLAEAERLGAQVSTYNFGLRTTNSEAGRYYAGLFTWSLGLAGNTPYNYVWLPSTGPGLRKQAYFDEQWKLSKPANLGHILPSPVGPVPGVGFEGRREGVDDYRYLQLLEARIAGTGENDATAIMAKRWLDRLRDESFSTTFLPSQSFSSDWMDPHPDLVPDDYDAIRVKAAAFILQLDPADGEANSEPAEVQRIMPFPLESIAYEDSSIEDCLKALQTGTIKQKRQAASALALRDPSQVVPALPMLIDLLDVPEVRLVALRAIVALGPKASPAMPNLIELLDHHDAFVRVGATYALTTIGPEATDILVKCKDDSVFTIANLATETLERWEKDK